MPIIRFAMALVMCMTLGCHISSKSSGGGDLDDDEIVIDWGKSEGETEEDLAFEAEANIDHPALDDASCFELFSGETTSASVFKVGNEWFVFYSIQEGDRQLDRLYLQIVNEDLSLQGEPETILVGARGADMFIEPDRLLLILWRQFYGVLLESPKSEIEWSEITNLAPDEPVYNCSGWTPSAFVKGMSQATHILVGNDFNTGIFGCYHRIFFTGRAGDEWGVPHHVSIGDISAAFANDERITIISTRGVFSSTDNGSTFNEVKGGETTNSLIRGSGAALVSNEIAMVQSYDWANSYSVAVLYSADMGMTWDRKEILYEASSPMFSPDIATNGTDILVWWYRSNSKGILMTASRDIGESWSQISEIGSQTGGSFNSIFAAVDDDTFTWVAREYAEPSSLQFCQIPLE